jgi:ADP-ribose pyrophosphatase
MAKRAAGGFKLLKEKEVLRSRVFRVMEQQWRLPGDPRHQRHTVTHPGAVAILPFDAGGNVLMIRQYRPAVRQWLLEIPAGTLEKGEAPLKCAKRELIEETGHAAKKWRALGEIFTAPGFCSEKIFLFEARGLTPAFLEKDADEHIELEAMSLAALLKAARAGKIIDSKTLSALLFYHLKPTCRAHPALRGRLTGFDERASMRLLTAAFLILVGAGGCGSAPQKPSPFDRAAGEKPAAQAPARPARLFKTPGEAVRELIESGQAGSLDGIKQCLTESARVMIERNDLKAAELAPPIAQYDIKPAQIPDGFPFAAVTVAHAKGSKTFYCRKDTGSWLVDWEQELSNIEAQDENHKIYDVSDKLKPVILQESERPKGWIPTHQKPAKTAPPGQPPSINFRHGEKPPPSLNDEAEQRFKNADGGAVRALYYDCKSIGDAQFRFWQMRQRMAALPGFSELHLADEAFLLNKAEGARHLPACFVRNGKWVLQLFNATREEALLCAGHFIKHTLSDNPHQ